MIRAFDCAKRGLSACQTRMGLNGENISNVETTGFKPREASFTDTLYVSRALNGGGQLVSGGGIKLDGIAADFGQGALVETGRALDFAVTGEGFFCVQGADGALSYTRAGNFYKTADGYLITARGDYVLDQTLARISVGPDGALETPGVFTFAAADGLSRFGDSLFAATDASGPPAPALDADVRQGCLERSGVDLAGEMARMIVAQRAFQAAARMVKAADEIEETVNQLRA